MKVNATATDEAQAVSVTGGDSRPLPVWVRAPVTGPEYYSGLTRAKLYQLDREGHIRSVSIQEPGQSRGCRLFHLESILHFIHRCEKERAAAD
jgi:hypothetical protein